MKAKLIKVIPQREGLPWYFRDYELECVDCGEHYTSGRYDSRTNPYCWKCKKVHDKEKAKERAKIKKQAEINEVLDKIKAEIEQIELFESYTSDIKQKALDIIDKYKESEDKE